VIAVFNMSLVIIIVVIVGGYLVSGFLHPFRPCRSCSGTGIHRGTVFKAATRACANCAGKGRFRRAGAPPEGQAFGERHR
jgi:DnaJ-class molecular chaperone